MITNTGLTILAKYLIGQAPSYASHLALGVGASPLDTDESFEDYSTKSSLDFEVLRLPITSRGYVYDEDGASNIVFAAELTGDQRYLFSEVGVFSAKSNPAAGNSDSKMVYTFSNSENWEYHNQTSASTIPTQVAPLNQIANNQFRISTDTINWVTQNSNFGSTGINSIVFDNNLWLAGGNTGQLRTSTNAVTWITQTSNFGSTMIDSIAYGNSLWVAGGIDGQLRRSTDAITWSTSDSGFGFLDIYSIAFGDSLWLAAGENGQISASTNAITWVTRNSNFGNADIGSIAYGNNVWVAAGNSGQLRTSTDSITWVTQNSTFGNTQIFSVVFDNNIWLSAGASGQLRVSTNAVSWTTLTSNFGTTTIKSIAYGNNLWVAAGNFGEIRSSTDSITWVTRSSTFGTANIESLDYGNNSWILGGTQSNGIGFTNEEGVTVEVFRTNSNNPAFNDSERVIRYEPPRFLDRVLLIPGNMSYLENVGGSLSIKASEGGNYYGTHIHLAGITARFNQSSSQDDFRLAFSILDKDSEQITRVGGVRILMEFASSDSIDPDNYARFEVDLDPSDIDFAANRYIVVVKKLGDLVKSSSFTWDTVNTVKIYAMVYDSSGSEAPSDEFYVALDGFRFENNTAQNPLYGMTGYSVFRTENARPIVKEANTSNIIEFRYGVDFL